MRYERKYRIEELDRFAVRTVIDGHPVSFRKLFPDRQINNIYLDTRDMSYFRENLSGVGQRRKYRIRWYGSDLEQVSKPVLEIKIKDGELGEKVSAKLPDFRMGTFPDVQKIVRENMLALSAAAPAVTDPKTMVFSGSGSEASSAPVTRRPFPVHDLVPALVNTYRRSYLISNDQRFRLTIDWDMHFYGMGPRFRPYRNFSRDEAVVVEVKYEAEHDAVYSRIGQHIPFRLGKNSKYVNGILLVGNV